MELIHNGSSQNLISFKMQFVTFVTLFLLLMGHGECFSEQGGNSMVRRIKRQSGNLDNLIPANYSIHHPPTDSKGLPTTTRVDFSILVMDVRDIKELNEELSIEMNMRVYWQDFRLEHLARNLSNDEKFRVLKPVLLEKIWHPDIFIDHVKAISQQALISKPASLRVYPKGDIRYSSRITVNVACAMSFHYYPADTQKCHFDIKSYAYTDRTLKLAWRDGIGAKIVYNLSLHNFDVSLDSTQNFILTTSSGNYSGIRFTILLRRKLSYHLIQTYLPSSLFIVVSWLSFLVPPESVPGRMALCVTTLLTLTAQFAAVRQNTPNVSYVKALDIWCIVCVIFVFLTLLEYTIILKLRNKMQNVKAEKKQKKKKNKNAERTGLPEPTFTHLSLDREGEPSNYKAYEFQIRRPKLNDAGSSDVYLRERDTEAIQQQQSTSSPTNSQQQQQQAQEKQKNNYAIAVKNIEKFSSICVPILFVIFNLVYWPWLLYSAEYNSEKKTLEVSE